MSKRALLAVIVIFIAFVAMDFVLHGVILEPYYAQSSALWRPQDQMMVWLIWLVVLVGAAAFVYVYDRFFAAKGMKTAVVYGLVFGIGSGIGMGYGSYAVMPIPYAIALGWFLGTVVEALVAGVLLGAIVKE
jgi:hypothetical protein